jgi:peptidoglycan/LPS O-acetylase OafA/YrhL
MIVLLGHIPYKDVVNILHGNLAVCLFYVISGFYIQLLLDNRTISIRNFYISRALRIYPLYWVMAITMLWMHLLPFLFHLSRDNYQSGLLSRITPVPL